MKYLAVDSDGTEWIFNYEIERHLGNAIHYSNQLLCYEDLENKKKDFWTMKKRKNWCNYANRIQLPKGSIYKLTGVHLSWDNEPISF